MYDYFVTDDLSYAEQTKKDEAMASLFWSELNETVIRCPALARPINGRKSENRYWPGTIVRFACNEGYRLTGYEVRRCREDGLWSWGIDPQCIPELNYRLQVGIIYISIIVPVLAMLSVIIYIAVQFRLFQFWRKENSDKKAEKLYMDREELDKLQSKMDGTVESPETSDTASINHQATYEKVPIENAKKLSEDGSEASSNGQLV